MVLEVFKKVFVLHRGNWQKFLENEYTQADFVTEKTAVNYDLR